MKKINLYLEKYKKSLRTTHGKIRFAELGWQQVGRVPDVALIRHYPSILTLTLTQKGVCVWADDATKGVTYV